MGIFAKIRQVYDRLCKRIEASADRMHQEREHLSEQTDKTYKRERQIAFEREWRKYSRQLGAHWGPL